MTSTKQRIIIAVSSVLVGCAVGATMPRLTAQSFPPSPSAQRWEQLCEDLGDDDMDVVNRRLAARSAEGFEFVSLSWETVDRAWVCFKRPAVR